MRACARPAEWQNAVQKGRGSLTGRLIPAIAATQMRRAPAERRIARPFLRVWRAIFTRCSIRPRTRNSRTRFVQTDRLGTATKMTPPVHHRQRTPTAIVPIRVKLPTIWRFHCPAVANRPTRAKAPCRQHDARPDLALDACSKSCRDKARSVAAFCFSFGSPGMGSQARF